MSEYYKAIKPFLPYNPRLLAEFNRPPSQRVNFKNWQEGKALELVYKLSGVAYVGLMRVLYLGTLEKMRTTVKPIEENRIGRKKIMEAAIEARRTAINIMLGEVARAEGINEELTPVGLVGLGLLRITSPDGVGEALIRLGIIRVLLEEDPVAAIIRKRYPNEFDGAASIRDLIEEQNLISITID